MTEQDLGKQEHGMYADYEECKAAYVRAVDLMETNGTPRAVIALYTSLAKTFFAENDLAISNNLHSLPPYIVHSDGTVVLDIRTHFRIGVNKHTGEMKVEPTWNGYDNQVIEGRCIVHITKGSEQEPGSIIDCDVLGRPTGKKLTISEIARIMKASSVISRIYEGGGRRTYSSQELDAISEEHRRIRFPRRFASSYPKSIGRGPKRVPRRFETTKMPAGLPITVDKARAIDRDLHPNSKTMRLLRDEREETDQRIAKTGRAVIPVSA